LSAACYERAAISPSGGVKAEHRIAECPCGGMKADDAGLGKKMKKRIV
jgi:hypothetical protein